MSSEDIGASKPGAALAEARQAQAVTQREVADALHLPLGVVDAIERGDKNALPGYVFTRGYVRAYAKLMELDPDPLVTALAHEYGADQQPEDEVHEATTGGVVIQTLAQMTRTQKQAAAGGAAGLVLLLLVWLIWPSAAPDNEVPLTQPEPEVAQISTDEAPNPIQPSQGETLNENVSSSGAETVRASVVERLPNLRSDPQTEPVDELRIFVREDCWIEVKRSDGSVVYGDLGRAGDTVEIADTGPFSILLGYAPGVTLEFNGESIALAPHTRNNVATFVIGQ